MDTINFEKLMPGLWQLNHDINSAYSGIHFLFNRGEHDESQKYAKEYYDLKRKKELMLKPIFGL